METNPTKEYLGLTLHYLENEEIHSTMFGVKPLDEATISEYLSQKLEEMCNKWNILKEKIGKKQENVPGLPDIIGKVKTIVTFSKRSKRMAGDIRKVQFANGKTEGTALRLIQDVPTRWNSSYAMMQRFIDLNGRKQENVTGLPDIIGKVMAIETFSKRSKRMAGDIRKVQFVNGKTEGTALRLIQDIPTRWNSTYAMLQHLIDLSDVIGMVILNIPESPPMQTGSELASIKLIVQILYPLYQVKLELSAEKTPTTSKVTPLRLTAIKIPDQDEVAKRLKECVIAGIEKRFGVIEQVAILAMSTLPDPRFKRLHFQSPMATAQAVSSISKAIVDVVKATKTLRKRR
ncbi:hypothetical protein PR048_015709 [Dryococelus australis]|uniref:Uncharacterized protein n=1 Tax=Dryococelus australis TaxID=614101 RepID=A0ABQ9HHZ5_9NEOP|nr:hypothetical protein PR048_015709 [Dryococelus australis]